MDNLFFRSLQHYDPIKFPWQKRAYSLLDRHFPNWQTKSERELISMAKSNPITYSRFATLWQGIPVYFSQRDNYAQPHRTCNSSSNAMFLVSFMPWLLYKGDNEYLQKVLRIGDTTSHAVQTRVLESYGLKTQWDTSGNFTKLVKTLMVKTPVAVNILHRGVKGNYRGGHIVLLYATDGSNFTYHDPYGKLSSDYKNFDGKSNKITHVEFNARWQSGARYLI